MEAQGAPKSRPSREKIDVEKHTFSTSIFRGFRPHFGEVFGKVFGAKAPENDQNTILAKTIKTLIFLREN